MSWGLASWRIFSNLIREKTLAHVQWFPITGFPPSDSNVFCTLHFMTDCLNFWFTFYYKKTILFVRSRTNHQWHFLVPVFFFQSTFYTRMCIAVMHRLPTKQKLWWGGGLKNLTYILRRACTMIRSVFTIVSLILRGKIYGIMRRAFVLAHRQRFLSFNWWVRIHASARILLGVHLRLIKLLGTLTSFFLFQNLFFFFSLLRVRSSSI